MKKTTSYVWVDEPQAVRDLAVRLAGALRVALDTEFIGEGLYYPKLCLVQIAAAALPAVNLLDPVADVDLRPVMRTLAQADCEIVMHAPRQDVEVLHQQYGLRFPHLFDTQVASAFLGYGDQPSLPLLLHDVLHIVTSKGERFTNWAQRPLSDAQLEYAAADVAWLLPLRVRLAEQLSARGRMQWFDDEMAQLAEVDFTIRDDRELWRRVSDRRGLKRRGLAILRELAATRERLAREANKPRESIAPDRLLLQLAHTAPASERELPRLRNWKPPATQTVNALIAAVQRGVETPEADLPEEERGSMPPPEAGALSDLLAAWLKIVASREQIASPLLALRSELDALARWSIETGGRAEPPPLRFLAGWRYEFVGRDLTDIALGRKAIGLHDEPQSVIALKRQQRLM